IALHQIWLQVIPRASWRDVINALKQCKENELARTIEDKVTDPIDEVVTDNLKDVLKTHSHTLTRSISTDFSKTASALYAKGLIPETTKDQIFIPGISDFNKAAKLVTVIGHQLPSDNPEQYLIDVCHVLIDQKNPALTENAASILDQLGQSVPDSGTEAEHETEIQTKPVAEIVQDDSANRVGYFSNAIEKKDLKPGDHIYTHRTLFLHSHHGIYIGEPDCEVIHFSGDATGSLRNKDSSLCQVRKTTLGDFCDGNTLRLVAYNAYTSSNASHTVKAMPLSETVKVAKHFLNDPKKFGEYGMRNNNSETFSCFCKTGLMDIAAQLHPLSRNVLAEWLWAAPCTTYEEAMKNFIEKQNAKT
ncbi:PREDICTED: uncharacterized protein LOC109588389, partial [Amphimedon queenslandica]|uniref:LRAT domain-containing protein n=1 Tax=Amphimedon queenslandica TaxID=400682 RepID=A0AAN0JTG5_AMPQE